jgi:hypothetical protein
LDLPADGVVRQVGAGSSGSNAASYWIVTVDSPQGSRDLRVLVQSRWDRSSRWVTEAVTDIDIDSSKNSPQCPPAGDPRFLVVAGADCPGAGPTAIPDRVALPGTGTEIIGWLDRKALERTPDFDAYPNDPDAAMKALMHDLIPVTKTKDRSSQVVGYYVRNFGYLEKAVRDAPGFDLDAIIAQGKCDAGRRVTLVDGNPTCVSTP